MSTATVEFAPDVRALLDDAAAWRLISLLFEYPAPGWHAQVARLAAEVRDPLLQDSAAAAQTEASEGLHQSIFGPGGPVSPREVTYLRGIQYGYLLSELRDYYRAFGFGPETAEADDHLSVEAAFMAYLKLKQAFALDGGQPEQAAVTAEAAVAFQREHLAQMAERIAGALAVGGPSFLALAGQALLERVGPAPRQPQMLPLADAGAPDADDDPLVCS